MDTASYAKRNAEAREKLGTALKRFADVDGFEDIETAFSLANRRDPQLQRLFELEAMADIAVRLANNYVPEAKVKPKAEPKAEPKSRSK